MANVDSIWRGTVQIPRHEPLTDDIRTDVLIVGGGLAGILCGYMLNKSGVNCVIADAGRICGGISGNTTAKLTVQHGLIYDKLIRKFGYEKAQMYLHANRLALDAYRELCAGTDCDFEQKDNYVYSVHNRNEIEREFFALERLGVPVRMTDDVPLPLETVGAVCVPDQAQFNPLKFASAIASKLRIYENTPVLDVESGMARTPRGTIRADRIIIATHFPIINRHGAYFMKLYQHRSYVLALENAADVNGMYVDGADTGMSFRSYGNLLLLGGGGHRTGKKGGGWRELRRFAEESFPQSRVVCHWATQDCMTLDGVPYIGQYSKNTPGIYVLTGFNKWGMTGAMTGAMLLKDMLIDRTPDWAEVFSPSRSVMHAQLLVNAAETAADMLTPTVPRCPHMGCALKYNPQEHSWNCPCHGSRFDNDGALIDGPAQKGLRRG